MIIITSIFFLTCIFSLIFLDYRHNAKNHQNSIRIHSLEAENIALKTRLAENSENYRKHLSSLELENEELRKILDIKQIKSQDIKLRNDCLKTEKKKLNDNLLTKPSDFYVPSNSCMTPNECRMYYYIETALFELFPYKTIKEKKYFVFPQVALHSIIEKREGLTQLADDTAFYAYSSKSIDFVICHCTLQNYKRDDNIQDATFYAYTPVLLIELDGDSHYSSKRYGRKAFQHQMENDKFKNSVFTDLHIPFLRYQLRNNSIYNEDSEIIKTKLKEYLSIL